MLFEKTESCIRRRTLPPPAGTASGRAEEGSGENEAPPSHFTLQQANSESAGDFVGEALDQLFIEVLHDDDV